MKARGLFVLVLTVALAGCAFQPPFGGSEEPKLVGEWRIYSETIFYDAGGSGGAVPVTRLLELNSDGTWEFGDSKGSWSVSAVSEKDWVEWGVDSYGPTRKIVLSGWSGGEADGPIEEGEERIDFFWVIYRAEPPLVENPGQVQIKFGR